MIMGGTTLSECVRTKAVGDENNQADDGERKLYALESNCGYLEKTGREFLCSIYEDVLRPAVCDEFKFRSPGCDRLRKIRRKKEFGEEVLAHQALRQEVSSSP